MEASKFFGYEVFPNYKWDSRVGSGSLTPNGWGSRLGSGALTPNNNLLDNQISDVASLANSDHKSQTDDLVVDHRVSFELFGEDIPTCVVREAGRAHKNTSGDPQKATAEGTNNKDSVSNNEDSSCREEQLNGEPANEVLEMPPEGEGDEFHQKHRTISLGSSKDFNFNNTKGEVSEKSSIDCEWWTNEENVKKESGPRNSWSFFPMLQSGAS